MSEWFFVSTSPHMVDTDDGSPPHYQTQADAEDAIKADEHGNYGTRYVIKATLETVSTASRSWVMVAGNAPADPFADSRQFNAEPHDPPSPTGTGGC